MSRLALIIPVLALATGLGAADNYAVDGVHSAAIFKVKHAGVAFTYGRFTKVSGTVVWDAANPAASSFEIAIDPESVDTENEKRDQHLRNPDFFDAKQFPAFGFKSATIKQLDDATFEVAGNLTIHGVTKPLTVKALKTGEGKDPWGGYRIGFETTFAIKRSDYGMTKVTESVGDDVAIIFSIESVKEKK
jgi:polyisoprenoid-binding protein YceI